MKVAAIQMVSGLSVEANLADARALLEAAAAGGAELAVLPEVFCFMGRKDSDKLSVREAFGAGPVQEFLARTARELGLWIVGGTLPLAAADEQHVISTCLVFDAQGERAARYDKIHLFKFDNGSESYDESRVSEHGSEPVAFDMTSRDGRRWRIGMSICYDVRFPELYRGLHADVLLVPSAFTYTTGQAHWEVLLRARAVENLAWVLAPAQGGVHENGRRTWGHTLIADPWGEVLAQQAQGSGVVFADLDAQRQAQLRTQLPALDHRVL